MKIFSLFNLIILIMVTSAGFFLSNAFDGGQRSYQWMIVKIPELYQNKNLHMFLCPGCECVAGDKEKIVGHIYAKCFFNKNGIREKHTQYLFAREIDMSRIIKFIEHGGECPFNECREILDKVTPIHHCATRHTALEIEKELPEFQKWLDEVKNKAIEESKS